MNILLFYEYVSLRVKGINIINEVFYVWVIIIISDFIVLYFLILC